MFTFRKRPSMPLQSLESKLGSFEIVGDQEVSAERKTESPYDWKPQWWVPYPIKKDQPVSVKPWQRPPQVHQSFVGVNIIDTEKGKIMQNMTVKIKEGKIFDISQSKSADLQEAEWDTVDAGGLFMCPGLIDCHVHIAIGAELDDGGLDFGVIWGLKGMLSNGFTTVRDVGGATRFHRSATEDWLIPGPRLFVGGPVLSQTGGHGDHTNRNEPAFGKYARSGRMGEISVLVDGVDECLKAARTLMMQGADHIKICSSGGVLSAYDKLTSSQFTVPEIKAVCDTGGTLVTSHCNTDEGARNGIEGGIGGIEHGGLLSEDTLKLMAKKGVHFTPTLIVVDTIVNGPLKDVVPPYSLEKAKMMYESSKQTTKRAVELGVNVAYGTDTETQFQLAEFALRGAFLPAHEVLKQATCNGAKVVNMEGKIGCIKVGAFADLLLLAKNPLDDITVMGKPNENLLAVVKDGRCVVSKVKGLRVEVNLV